MAQYKITYACGHTGIVNLLGKYDERERKIAWLETQECPECQKARAAQIAEATESELNLPSLSGSDKQIAWAKSIRATYLRQFNNLMEGLKSNTTKPEMMDTIFGWLCSQTESKFWIDNRDSFEAYVDVKAFIRTIADIYRDLYLAK